MLFAKSFAFCLNGVHSNLSQNLWNICCIQSNFKCNLKLLIQVTVLKYFLNKVSVDNSFLNSNLPNTNSYIKLQSGLLSFPSHFSIFFGACETFTST